MSSVINEELLKAYRTTHFNVIGPPRFTLQIGDPSRQLSELYRAHKVATAAFLTAWNPHSKEMPQAENDRAQAQLETDVNSLAAAVLPGLGQDPYCEWPGEPSVLALGLSRDVAKSLGAQYRQNAIVWIGGNLVPELVLLR